MPKEQKFNLKVHLQQGWKLDSKTLKEMLERDTILRVDEVEEI
jgi:hypothetical protein